MSSSPLLVPVQIEAFVLNPDVCNGQDDDSNTGARIAPITQPNYTFLRLNNFMVQNDVLSHIDLHNAAPAGKNSRMVDLGQNVLPPPPKRHRHGVYVHWILPRAYRAGSSVSEERYRRGLPSQRPGEDVLGASTPEYIEPPTRWLVIRKLDLTSINPEDAQSKFKEYQAWVVESDFLWKLDEIPLAYDLQVDVSPFVVGMAGEDVDVVQQAEVFIGRKTPLESWSADQDATYTNISLLRSRNQLFADFQLHNTNVFSILDNFQYTGNNSKTLYLDKATASYYLLGWHSTDYTDPLWCDDVDQSSTRAEKLAALFMALQDTGIPETTSWLKSTESTRLLCHGAIYNVKWEHSEKPEKVPADDYANIIQRQDVPAISVGTTPMDSLISYCAARRGYNSDDSVAKLEEDILSLDSLLHARDDGVEGQREAKDTVYNWNFVRCQGGKYYFLGQDDDKPKPTRPDPDSISVLKELNQYQMHLDSCSRTCRQYRWDMFACWWKYVSDVSNKDDQTNNDVVKKQADDLFARISGLEQRIVDLQTHINGILHPPQTLPHSPRIPWGKTAPNMKTGTSPFFYRARDPTVLVGGIESGWPLDYLDNLSVRLPAQLVQGTAPDDLQTLISDVKTALPVMLGAAAAALCTEFHVLIPDDSAPQVSEGETFPQFHDQKTTDERWRDQWGDRQPWFPLFAEWEVEYTHIPFPDYWSLDEWTSRLSDNKRVRYGVRVPSGKPLFVELGSADTHDTRILSGRALVLPQPSFSLAAKVKQLFADTPPQLLDQYLDEADREDLLNNIGKLSYLSFPLAGLTDGLLTLAHGTHIKPENKDKTGDGDLTAVIKAAEFDDAGLTAENLGMISGNSALTPFASAVRFTDKDHCPFKPVTHGQFRFRKFNIIDKFGQALAAIDPQPRSDGPPPLYPCISDFYEPQKVEDSPLANTVIEDNPGQCEFIQLPPQINQNARLNAVFVVRTSDDQDYKPKVAEPAYWRPMTEWENPIWGWIVVNYADYGLQLFLPDGTFYREVRFGGPNGELTTPAWTPFDPNLVESSNSAQLMNFVTKLGDMEYLKGFWTMITDALDNLPTAPNAYAQFLASIVGKPFALVNMGFSLELDGPPLQNQSTTSVISDPERTLLPTTDLYYTFQVKLGDKEREYDGLVGYFDAKAIPEKGNELELDYINTYCSDPGGPLRLITAEGYPEFTPYWIPPFPELAPYSDQTSPDVYVDCHNKKLQVYGAIIDPFTPVHAYSSLLPALPLQLPSWTWQQAMNTMTAFFHAGPLTLTGDVQSYDSSWKLTTENMKDQPPHNVEIPALGAGDWNWLQPYVEPGLDGDLDAPPVFNSYGIEKKGNILKPGFQSGPYTAIEGFLQLRDRIMVEKPG